MRATLLALAFAGAVLAGCAGVPAAVVWSSVGAGLGFGAAALKFDDDVLALYERDYPAPAKPIPR